MKIKFLEKNNKFSAFKDLKISIYKFNKPNIKFPNLDGTHVTRNLISIIFKGLY